MITMGKIIIFNVCLLLSIFQSFAWESSADRASKARWSQDQIEYYAESYSRFLENLDRSSTARENQVKSCLVSVNFSYKSCLGAYSQGDGGVTYWVDRCSEIHYPVVDKGRSSEALGCCRMFSGTDLSSCRKFVYEHLDYDASSEKDILLSLTAIRSAVEDTGICHKVGSSRDNSTYCQKQISRSQTEGTSSSSEVVDQSPRNEVIVPTVPSAPAVNNENEDRVDCDSPKSTEELNICQLRKMRNSQSL